MDSSSAGKGGKRDSVVTIRLRKVINTVMSVNAACNEEQKLEEYRETIRLAVGDAVRRYLVAPPSARTMSPRSASLASSTNPFSGGSSSHVKAAVERMEESSTGKPTSPEKDLSADTELLTSSVAEQFFEMMRPELKSLSHSKGSIQKLEAELDFLTKQMQRRDEVSKQQREELIKELQASNEHVRQLTMIHNDFVESVKRSRKAGGGGVPTLAAAGGGAGGQPTRTPARHHMPAATGGDASSSSSPAAPSGGGGEDDDAASHATAAAQDHGGGGANAAPMSPTHAVASAASGGGGGVVGLAYLAQLVSTTTMSRQMTAALEDIDTAARMTRREDELRAEFDIKNRATMKAMRQEHTVNMQKLSRKHEETLRAETHKLETKVKQLEGQLRKRELENEQLMRSERERWKTQIQRVVDGSESKLRQVTANLQRQCELHQMFHHDTMAHTLEAAEELREEIADSDRRARKLDAEVKTLKTELQEKELLFSLSQINVGTGFRDADGDSPAAGYAGHASMASRPSNLGGSATERLLMQSDNPVSGPSTGKERSPASRRGSKLGMDSLSSFTDNGGGSGRIPPGGKGGSKAVTLAALRQACDNYQLEATALREQLDASETALAVTKIARDEAIEERKAIEAMLSREGRTSRAAAASYSFTEPSTEWWAPPPAGAAAQPMAPKSLSKAALNKGPSALQSQTSLRRGVSTVKVVPSTPIKSPRSAKQPTQAGFGSDASMSREASMEKPKTPSKLAARPRLASSTFAWTSPDGVLSMPEFKSSQNLLDAPGGIPDEMLNSVSSAGGKLSTTDYDRVRMKMVFLDGSTQTDAVVVTSAILPLQPKPADEGPHPAAAAAGQATVSPVVSPRASLAAAIFNLSFVPPTITVAGSGGGALGSAQVVSTSGNPLAVSPIRGRTSGGQGTMAAATAAAAVSPGPQHTPRRPTSATAPLRAHPGSHSTSSSTQAFVAMLTNSGTSVQQQQQQASETWELHHVALGTGKIHYSASAPATFPRLAPGAHTPADGTTAPRAPPGGGSPPAVVTPLSLVLQAKSTAQQQQLALERRSGGGGGGGGSARPMSAPYRPRELAPGDGPLIITHMTPQPLGGH